MNQIALIQFMQSKENINPVHIQVKKKTLVPFVHDSKSGIGQNRISAAGNSQKVNFYT